MTQLERKSAPADWSTEVGRRAPNVLTGFRILIVPVFVVLLIEPTPKNTLWATVLFVVASFTDWLDGFLARLYNAESNFGRLLDPLADKVLVMAALVTLVEAPPDRAISAWIVVVLLAREMVINSLRSIAVTQGIVVEASRFAKHKTAWTMLSIFFLLVGETYTVGGVLIDFHRAGMVFLWIALAFSVISGIQYAVALRKVYL